MNQLIKIHFADNYIPDLPNNNTFHASKSESDFTKIYLNEYVKVKYLGKSQKGHAKWLMCLKNTYKTEDNSSCIKHKLQFAEGIIFANSTTLNSYALYECSITIPKKIRKEFVERKITEPKVNREERITRVESGVYLFFAENKNNLFKIGKSTNVFSRYQNILTGNPDLEFVGFIKTEDINSLEPALHAKFQHLHYKREWFLADDEILNFFKNHKDWISTSFSSE